MFFRAKQNDWKSSNMGVDPRRDSCDRSKRNCSSLKKKRKINESEEEEEDQ
jgi:hypothetical protein